MGNLVNHTNTNLAVLADHLHRPHMGQANGLLRPEHWAQGEDGTCACPRVPAEFKASNVLDKTPLVRPPSSQGGIDEKMETAAVDDLEDLPAGANPLATKVTKVRPGKTKLTSCKPVSQIYRK